MYSYKKCILTIILIAVQVSCHHQVLAEGEPCRNTVHSSTGTCVSASQCPPYKALILTYGALASDLLRDALCYYTRNYPIVCCPTADPVLQAAAAPARHWAFPAAAPVVQSTATGSVHSVQLATDGSASAVAQSFAGSNARKPSIYGPLYMPHCGLSKAVHLRSPAPTEGYPADLHAYPWLVALGYQSRSDQPLQWMCAGSLISARHVLTSAQCVHGRSDLSVVRLGDHDLYDDNDGAYPINMPIERITVHPNFKSSGDGNALADIAVIRLQRDIKFSDDIHPICLPFPDDVRYKDYTAYHPFLAGWGSLHREGVAKHSVLEFWYPVLSTDQCRKSMTKGFKIQEIDEHVLCTGYVFGESNACLTDKGAALMYPIKGPYFHAIGVLSSSIGCERNQYPRVYTRVSQYLDFILDNIY